METKKFMELNGKPIFMYVHKTGNWIPIKPVCNALGINYWSELRKIKGNEIYGWPYSVIDAKFNGKIQPLYSLPEKLVYGWLFGLKCKNKSLFSFKRECHEILFEKLNGSIIISHPDF